MQSAMHRSQRLRGTLHRGGAQPCIILRRSNFASQQVAVRALAGLDISMPEIDGELKSVKRELGATFDETGDVALTFGNSRQAIAALESGVVLVDRSHWGRVRVTGPGRLAFLHNQSTNAFTELRAGQGCDTVFVTSTARTLDLATALVNENSVMLLVSPNTRESLVQRFDKFIFPGDGVEVQDVTERCAMLTLLGPEAEVVLKEVAGDTLKVLGQPYGSHQLVGFKGGPLIVISGGGLSGPGYTLIVEESMAGDLFALLASKGCVLMGDNEWEIARVLDGRPSVGHELTEEVNPLEAGLYHAVSLNKGCYIGQETLSKLAGLDGVKQQLWGLRLKGPVPAGSEVQRADDGSRVGRVTSVAVTPDGEHTALAFIKCKSKGAQVNVEGMSVTVGGVQGTVTAIPYASRVFADQLSLEVAGPGAEARIKAAEEARAQKEAEAAAKAERLREMTERLAAWQAAQFQGAGLAPPGQQQQQ